VNRLACGFEGGKRLPIENHNEAQPPNSEEPGSAASMERAFGLCVLVLCSGLGDNSIT